MVRRWVFVCVFFVTAITISFTELHPHTRTRSMFLLPRPPLYRIHTLTSTDFVSPNTRTIHVVFTVETSLNRNRHGHTTALGLLYIYIYIFFFLLNIRVDTLNAFDSKKRFAYMWIVFDSVHLKTTRVNRPCPHVIPPCIYFNIAGSAPLYSCLVIPNNNTTTAKKK